jgi:YidC/Oxa1 family membrane protein insertase
MTDMRRTLIWVVFMMSLFLLWEAWQKHNGHPGLLAGGQPPAATPSVTAASASLPSLTPDVRALATAPAVPGTAASAAAPRERITVSTDLVKATIDTMGGSIVGLELLKHQEHGVHAWYEPMMAFIGMRAKNAEQKNIVLFDSSAKRQYAAQTGLVTSQAGQALPNHLTPMVVTTAERELATGAKELIVRLVSAPEGGLELVKTYTFRRGDYTIGVKHDFVNGGSVPVSPLLYLQLERDGNPPEGESSFYFTFTGPAVYTDVSKYKKLDFKDIAKGSASYDTSADSGWVAMVQHYFASAWLEPAAGPRQFSTAKVGENYYVRMLLPLGEVAPGATKSREALLFAGPQEEDKLAALAPGLELVKDYGWLTILSKPLFWLLTQLHAALNNWGWAIVALVVLLKIAFYWLNSSAYRSMAKMKAVAPKVTELRERLKDKPQQMQQEMMRIYREEKVNPLGGCLPIFVQMPFFIALYWVLLSSVEMRAAPWVAWISDLSVPDPLFILPTLMTLSSLLQVWLNPAPPDPVQAKMMWIMPLAFGIMFFAFPAGLVLYWLTNNILSIAQQWFINKRLGVLGK